MTNIEIQTENLTDALYYYEFWETWKTNSKLQKKQRRDNMNYASKMMRKAIQNLM